MADVDSIDAIVAALYDSISGPAGTRDWDRLRALFLPDARLRRTVATSAGGTELLTMDVDAFVARAAEHFAKSGFWEKEIARRVERYGHVAQVWSTYESRHREEDPAPFVRGINGIQLFHDGTRWWVVQITWDDETSGGTIPGHYLSG